MFCLGSAIRGKLGCWLLILRAEKVVQMEFSLEFKRYFAIATLALALVHFVLETAYTIIVGQHFLGYLPDCIADALLVAGAYLLLKNEKSTGVLCGAWGFTFCLHYRS